MIYTSNLQRSGYDSRDFQFCGVTKLPEAASVEQWIHNVEQQNQINACTTNALGAATELALKRNGTPKDASRLFMYYWARYDAGATQVDAGSSIRYAFKNLAKRGVCEEYVWPYDDQHLFVEPPVEVQELAKSFRCTRYENCGTGEVMLNNVQTAIAMGYPVVFGMPITSQLMGLRPDEKYIGAGYDAGLHAMLIVAYDNNRQAFLVQNSWGAEWAIKGYFWLDYALAKPAIFDAFIAKEFTGITYQPTLELPRPTVRIYLDNGETFSIAQSANVYGGSIKGTVVLLPSATRVWCDGNVDEIVVPWKVASELQYLQTGNVLHVWNNGTELGRLAINGSARMTGSDRDWPIELIAGKMYVGGCKVSEFAPDSLE